MRGKLVGLFAVVLLALVGLLGRITYINATSGKKYKKQVLTQAQQKYQSSTLPAKRGDIYDRNGNILATSQKVYSVILDCKTVNSDEKYVEPTVRALTDVLGLDEDKIRSILSAEDTKNSQYQILKKQLSMDEKKGKFHTCGKRYFILACRMFAKPSRSRALWTESNLNFSFYSSKKGRFRVSFFI